MGALSLERVLQTLPAVSASVSLLPLKQLPKTPSLQRKGHLFVYSEVLCLLTFPGLDPAAQNQIGELCRGSEAEHQSE